MNDSRDPSSRLRQRLNPLLTSLSFSQSPNTPVSALSYSSNSINVSTPASAIQPYNPQQWIPSPMPGPGPERSQQTTSPDSNGSPLPPPPYSPPRSQRPTSMYVDNAHPANISLARAPPPVVHRPSPEPSNGQSFPPPPNARGASRERRFGFASLGRRKDVEPTTTTESPGSSYRPIISSTPSAPAPLAIQIPQFSSERTGMDTLNQGLPPGARRAASTGALDTPTSARSRSASQSRWETGMPLPPPPPGPPPSQSRSQSANRNFSSSGSDPVASPPVASPPTRRPPPTGVTTLGPVPPTPANWVDDGPTDPHRVSQQVSRHELSTRERPDLEAAVDVQEPGSSSASPNTGLNRNNARRGEKTLRERRNESRTRSSRLSIDASVSNLEDIVIPPSSGERRTYSRVTPRSAGQSQDTPHSGADDREDENSGSTPKAIDSARRSNPAMEMSTPPFSPRPMKPQSSDRSSSIAPKALPTPPPHSRSASASTTRMALDPVIPTPHSSRSVNLTRDSVIRQTPDHFCQDTIERFKSFAQKEASAADDAERVRLFADFIVSESRIRRERYSTSISAMGSEIFDLTRDLFRPMASRRESVTSQGSEWTPQSSEPTRSHRGSISSVFRGESSKQAAPAPPPLSTNIVPLSPSGPPPNAINYSSNYRPALSPILSMSVSNSHDDDSRGRPASRWWESASSGESTKWERSKRESKYMSVPKEAREALQWMDTPSVEGSSRQDPSDEYPPEKQGWHESPAEQSYNQTYNTQPTVGTPQPSLSLPNTPNPNYLDVSRLVTLPPPYPRHHPAVNNNHPDLAEIRVSVRTLSDLSEVDATKTRFNQDSRAMRDEGIEAANKRRQALRLNLQQEVGLGRMTYGEAAAIEADSNESEKQATKDLEKKDFDRFQTAVVVPLNEILTKRIATATSLFDELRSRLFVETREPNPNMPQEEGDELPELLEKLTLLKWIFEAREILHRAVYDLLSDRNDRYREMVIMPYRLAGNEAKMAHASAFFAEDAGKRALTFANDVLQRTVEFRDVVEENVVRGVEVQSSAFWDIAPPLCRLLDRVPLGTSIRPAISDGASQSAPSASGSRHAVGKALADFRIQIPQSEVIENPSYVDHPLQYLFSLVLHAEKSTYQFIESQTNLFCLLHEVKEAVLVARARVMEEEHGAGGQQEVETWKREEGKRLTDDLKEKVRVVQEQWRDALGEKIRLVKERVGEWLLQTGGWDESLEDRGVGSL